MRVEPAKKLALEGHRVNDPGNEIDSQKLRNTIDEFSDWLLHFNPIGRIGFHPIAAGQKQPFKRHAECRIGIEVSGDQANSGEISIGGRLVIPTDGFTQTFYEGLQKELISGSHSEVSVRCPINKVICAHQRSPLP
jgi:hypothetical protein